MTALIVLALIVAGSPVLEDGRAIPVGTPDRTGPLAAGLTTVPVGCAKVSGGAQPDLFVAAGRLSDKPGLFLYRWVRTAADGTPVFAHPVPVRCPYTGEAPPPCTIYQAADVVNGLFVQASELLSARYDQKGQEFSETGRIRLSGLPRAPEAVAVLPNPEGSLEFLLQISDGVDARPTDFDWRDPRYRPFDGAGIWRGGLPYVALYAVRHDSLRSGTSAPPRLVSPSRREVLWRNNSLSVVKLAPDRARDAVSGSWFGNLYYYRNRSASGLDLEPRRLAVGEDGIALRHPACGASPIAYPDPRTGLSNLIAGGEGSLYFYRFTGRFGRQGQPIFRQPVPVLEQDARLYSGSLPVPNIVDWDGDGALDIVSGNSEGRVLFFRNLASNARPAFANGIPIHAGGYEIHVQPGYKEDIQGPGEARWGYASPTVVDWNGDGLPDILMSDSTARHRLYLNRGSKRAPRLEPAHPLYLDGLDLHGTWRVKPGAARLGDRMAYVALDDDDQFHLYWRIDDYNLEDGGKLRLEDGSPIGANFLAAGGTGRAKFTLVDWNLDGVTDILVGTPRPGSVPEPKRGLPQSLGRPGAAVLFLKNTGTNAQPVFGYPVLIRHRGNPVFFGPHECGAAVGDLGGGRSLVVGHQDGRLLFYRREHLQP